MTPADPQRARVYEAETLLASMIDRRHDYPVLEAFGSRILVPEDRKFGDIDSVRRYVDAVLALDWVRHAAPVRAARTVSVRARRGAARAEYDFATATIAVPPHAAGGRWAMRELVVLHEIAHHLADPADPAHGAAFVGLLLTFVDGVIGPEAAFLLRANLQDSGVALA